ncbi:MAG: phosphatidylglycerophosphatase A [Gammaproteobacteria bacterium]
MAPDDGRPPAPGRPVRLGDPRILLATGLGAGLARRAPGTCGTLVALPLYGLLSGLPPAAYVAVVLSLFAAGIWVCGHAARELGGRDPGMIVFDEIVGYLATMTLAPPGWGWAVAGFALFRLFDIAKPWPVSVADARVHGGLGIMLDDLAAACYAALSLQLLVFINRLL